jgi:glycosyltransferase involved in cell wall biosynthesis
MPSFTRTRDSLESTRDASKRTQPSPYASRSATVGYSMHRARRRGGRQRLRIAVVAPVWLPVPPSGYGGTERVVHVLVEGLVDAGHDVTLFAAGESSTRATLSCVYPKAPTERMDEAIPELRHALACFDRAYEFDLIHDHSGLVAISLAATTTTPVIHTVHVALDAERAAAYGACCRVSRRVGLISLSFSQRRSHPELRWVANCPNGLDLSAYPLGHDRDDYLLFLGRISPDKGCDRAIEVAHAVGLPLKIAAKCRQPEEQAYFRSAIEPQLDRQIQYLGEVGQAEKVKLLQNARAMLMPIDWEEPFGLVMIESMACGTPVIATRRGAVPEVIADGVSGIIVDDYHDMPTALLKADQLDRHKIRRHVEEHFSATEMVESYLRAYRSALSRSATDSFGEPPFAQRATPA